MPVRTMSIRVPIERGGLVGGARGVYYSRVWIQDRTRLSSVRRQDPRFRTATSARRRSSARDSKASMAAHLAIMDHRLGDALHAAELDGAVVFAGDEKIVFRDDQAYPFKAEPYFKAWVPLTQAPGSFLRLVPGQRPMLVYKQLEDYWHEPPSDPSGYWTSHFDIRVVRSEEDARTQRRGPALGRDRRGAARPRGSAPRRYWRRRRGARDGERPKLLAHLDFFARPRRATRSYCMRGAQLMAVRGHRPSRRRSARRIGIRAPPDLLHRGAAARDGAALLEHRRAERARFDAALSELANACAVAATLALDRRRSGIQRLCR